MFKNNLKIALRNLLKNKVFSLLNFAGLAVGMTAFFLIFLYVNFELSYDTFHSKSDRIYRLSCDIKTPSELIQGSGSSAPMGKFIKKEFPEVEDMVRFYETSLLVRKGDLKIEEENTMYVDASVFSIFDFELKSGDTETALTDPFSIVISESLAKKYFGKESPVGQTVILGTENYSSKITGVMKDIPANSQFKAEMYVSIETLKRTRPGIEEQWGNFGATTFLLLKPQSNPQALQKKFPSLIGKHYGESLKKDKMSYTLLLEPLKDVYLKSGREGFKTGNINNIYIFSVIGIFILLIAFINYVNLTTARSTERAKEVGIKKVVGAGSNHLAVQFIIESIIVCLVAFILACLLSFVFLPLFNQLAGKEVSSSIFENPAYLLQLFLISIAIGLIAGLYPAFVLSSFKPVAVLKGKFSTGRKGIILRKGLVVTQFTIAISMIIGTIVVYNQLEFMRNEDLGFTKDHILVIDTYQDKQKDAYKEEILKIPGVKSTSFASSIPGGGNMGAYSQIENKSGEMQAANLALYFVDFNYIPQYKIKVVAGRAFDTDFATDTTQAMILNEAAVRLFGYSSPDEAIGRKFSQWGREGKIVGVVKNFHFRSLKEEISPLSIRINPEAYSLLSVNVSSKNLKTTIASLEEKWMQMIPERPFNYNFTDEFFNQQYRSEEQFGKLFFNFAILAIIISCLGLLGLALYSTLQRTKEIGIRKTLGASVGDIVNLLSKDFLTLVMYSFLIASPLAGWLMYKWLENFAYRIDLNWWFFALGGISAIIIAFATVSFQAVKAAIANPVKSLRSE